ncbi:hypothetical protein U1701_11040 [Sphingomonas sp. PB2P19]|uniref:hypothetical protein n=1 Tax=Sphingomonas rhamnosi TaxID=3096156 RepID=UPI002FCC0961
MDQAFRPLSTTLLDFAGHSPVIGSEPGQRLMMTGLEIASPVQLDVTRGPDGRLRIGTTPPLYPLMTTVGPVFHRLTLRAAVDERDEDTAEPEEGHDGL